MSATENATTGDDIAQAQADLQKLLSRSATDQEFRKKLLATPRDAVSEFYGRAIPESMDIRFVENTADATFVLPDSIDPAAELNEQELEAVAGGLLPIISILSCIASALELTKAIKNVGDDSTWF